MKSLKIIMFSVGLLLSGSSYSANCPDGKLSFSFNKIDVLSAYAIIADYAGLKPEFDPSIHYAAPIYFTCEPWRKAAEDLARRFKVTLKIENGVMYVNK